MRRFAKALLEAENRLQAAAKTSFDDRVAEYLRLLTIENKWLEQQRKKCGGLELGRKRADTMDDWLGHLLNVATERLRAAGKKPPVICLVGLGGYGRRELNPLSDIDFTILHTSGARLRDGLEDIVKEFLNIILACGYTPGHSTRNLGETVAEANKEMKTKTAMLDARLLWGEEALYKRFQARFRKDCIKPFVKEYLLERVEDQARRHNKDGHTVYMQEPNIKDGCGGLRDYQNLLWMARVKYGLEEIHSLSDLVERKYLNESEQRELDRAYEWIFRLRTELHYVAERPQDIVFVSQQKILANRLDYDAEYPDVLRRTEAFMRDYFTHARAIFELTELVSGRLALPTAGESRPRGLFRFLPFRRKSRRKVEEFDGFKTDGVEITCCDRQIFKEDKPRMMRLFHHMQVRRLALSPELRQLVRRRLKYVDRPFRYLKANREVFADILRRKGEVGAVLHAMHRVDFLGRWMPEFGALTALVQHEFFHRYTVDEHTLVCVEKLDGLLDTEDPRFELHKALFLKMEDAYILYLALVLHDTGKAANTRDHVTQSTINADKVSRRLQLTREQRALLIFLVDNHDLLGRTVRQQDIYDAETVEQVARLVQNQANLDALMLLTAADGLGVGDEKMWNDWVQSLVRELYRHTSQFLADSAGFRAQRQIELDQLRAAVHERLGSEFAGEVDAHFTKMPERYFHIPHGKDTTAAIVTHLKMVREFLEFRWNTDTEVLSPVLRWVPQHHAGHSELWVCTCDRAQLLERIAGAISAAELNILSADIFTRSDGIVLDKFRVSTPKFEAVEHPVDLRKVERLLNAALGGPSYDFGPELEKVRSRAWGQNDGYAFPARVWYDNSPPKHTVVELVAPDRLGLLYEVLGCIGEAGFEISSARITTEKGAAIDTFHITGLDGAKITDEHLLIALKQVMKQLAGNGAA